MAIQYYSLEEAARLLNVSPDELKMMSRRGEPRPFMDRGTPRFRVTEIDEMARRKGIGSDADVPATVRKKTSGVRKMLEEQAAAAAAATPPKRRTSEVKRAEAAAAEAAATPKRRSDV